MRTLRLELLDEDGATVCRGLALLWERDTDAADGWGGELFQVEEAVPPKASVIRWIRMTDGTLHPVSAGGVEERSSGGQRTVCVRFRGTNGAPPLRRSRSTLPRDPGYLA